MDTEFLIRSTKHFIKKTIGKPDPVWPFYLFEHSINPKTIGRYPEVLSWAQECVTNIPDHESAELYLNSNDPVVIQGYNLKRKIEEQFKNKHATRQDMRFLIQIPDQTFSPGAYSAFSNIIESLNFIGIPAFPLEWNADTKQTLDSNKPTIFLITNHADFLARVNWDAIAAYKATKELHIGLLAHLEEYNNSPLLPRLDWAKKHDVEFYFSFRNKDYITTREAYKPFFEHGYEIFPIEFGANILHYYPVPGITRDIDYVFIASTNWTKGPQYKECAGNIIKKYVGFIDGGGWKHVSSFSFNKDRDRYIYARGKVGLNFHLQEQIDWASEVNERTHQLAACGIPQLTNNAKLLPELYSGDAIAVASTRKEFEAEFKRLLSDSAYAESRALKAQKEVFEKYTTFHRADAFVAQLSAFLNIQ